MIRDDAGLKRVMLKLEFNGALVIESKEVFLNNKTVVVGFPGMAFIGKMTAEVLIDKLKLDNTATIYTLDSPGVVPVDSGILKPPAIKVYSKPDSPIAVITSDYQPRSDEGMNRVAHQMLKYLSSKGASSILAAAAFVKPSVGEKRVVYVASSSEEKLKSFEALGCIRMDGGISGLNGLIPGLAPAYGMDGSVLLGETSELFVAGNLVDYRGVACVVEVISKAFNIKIDLSDVIEKASMIEKRVREAIEEEVRRKLKSEEREEFSTHM